MEKHAEINSLTNISLDRISIEENFYFKEMYRDLVSKLVIFCNSKCPKQLKCPEISDNLNNNLNVYHELLHSCQKEGCKFRNQ